MRRRDLFMVAALAAGIAPGSLSAADMAHEQRLAALQAHWTQCVSEHLRTQTVPGRECEIISARMKAEMALDPPERWGRKTYNELSVKFHRPFIQPEGPMP